MRKKYVRRCRHLNEQVAIIVAGVGVGIHKHNKKKREEMLTEHQDVASSEMDEDPAQGAQEAESSREQGLI